MKAENVGGGGAPSMDGARLRQVLSRQFGLRVGNEVSRYVGRRLGGPQGSPAGTTIPVLGGDARTGVPRRLELPSSDLLNAVRALTATPVSTTH